jgi:hypothetical protein
MRRVFEEGVRYLEEIKVYKSAKEDREAGEPFSKKPPFTSDVLRRSFTVTGGKTFFEFVWMLTWAPYPSGAKTRPLFELAKAKKKYLDSCEESSGLVSYFLCNMVFENQ